MHYPRERCPARAMMPDIFKISVPVQPGNSGGALVDERGNVVGVVSAKLNARRRSYRAVRCRKM